MENIDIVVTWVDAKDKSWQVEYIKHKNMELAKVNNTLDIAQAFGPERTRDWDVFRFWFRGVEQNCPWVHKIFLVVQKESQIPSWLNRNHPKLQIVYHQEFIPAEFLPTFSGTTIEHFLSFIPGLSNYWINCNDDCYFLNYVPYNYFWENEQPVSSIKLEPLEYYPVVNGFSNTLNNSIDLCKKLGYTHRYYFSHLQELRCRDLDKSFIEANKEVIYASLRGSKFRQDKNISSIIYAWILKHDINTKHKDIYVKSLAVHLADKTNFNNYSALEMVCFNDTEFTNFDINKPLLQQFFITKFPAQSSFEIDAPKYNTIKKQTTYMNTYDLYL